MTPSPARRRKVHFLPGNDSVSEIANDYTDDEAQSYWFSDNEITKIAVRSLKEALKASDSDDIRGLEVSSLHGKEVRDAAIRTCVDAVLDQQDIQWENDIEDFDRLATVSQDVSASSIKLALERAKKDELEAQRIYQNADEQQMVEQDQSQPTTKVVSKKKFNPYLDDATTVCSDLSGLDSLQSSRRHSLETFVGSSMEMESLLTLSSEAVDLSQNSTKEDTILPSIEVEQVSINDNSLGNLHHDNQGDIPANATNEEADGTSSAKGENAESTSRGKWRTALGIRGMVVVASSLYLLYSNLESLRGTRDTCLEVASDILLYPVSSV